MSNYEPFDQERVLGRPPWAADDPRVEAWERAHGHDVRLKCYAEFGCLVIEPTLERRIEVLEAALSRHHAEYTHGPGASCPVCQTDLRIPEGLLGA